MAAHLLEVDDHVLLAHLDLDLASVQLVQDPLGHVAIAQQHPVLLARLGNQPVAAIAPLRR